MPSMHSLIKLFPHGLFCNALKVTLTTKKSLFKILFFVFKAAGGKIEEQLDNGLVMGHAYSITDVIKVSVHDAMLVLLPLKWCCC